VIRKPFEGNLKAAFGKPLAKLSVKLPDGTVTANHGIKVLPIKGEVDAYTEDEAGYQELIAKGEGPDHMEVVRWRNAKLLAAAKGAANTKAIKDNGFVEPTAENDPSILLNTFYTAFMAVVKLDPQFKDRSEDEQKAEARRRAAEQSGLDWPDEDND
jgi:hypothetical protein